MLKIEEALNSLYRKIVGLRDDVQTALAGKQDIISAGDGVDLSDGTLALVPVETVVQEGQNMTIHAPAVGTGLTYQWQYSATGKSWANTTLTGNKTDTITAQATASRDGYLYRCVVRGEGCVYTTNPVRLRVMKPGSDYAGGRMTALPFPRDDMTNYYTKAESDAAIVAAAEQAHIDVTAETAARTIADAALKRSLDMLWRLNEGISYVFEMDSAEAYSKAVPSGAVVGDVQSVGGKSIRYSQMLSFDGTKKETSGGVIRETIDGWRVMNGTVNTTTLYDVFSVAAEEIKPGFVYYVRMETKNIPIVPSGDVFRFRIDDTSGRIAFVTTIPKSAIFTVSAECSNKIYTQSAHGIEFNDFHFRASLFNLTAMFGAGNEPTAEQFEAMFPADYYPYTPPAIISADMESVDVRGANRWSPVFFHNAFAADTVVNGDVLTVLNTNPDMYNKGIPFYINQGEFITVYGVGNGNGTTNARVRIIFEDETFTECYVTDAEGKVVPKTTRLMTKNVVAIRMNWSKNNGGFAFKMSITPAEMPFMPYKAKSIPIPAAIRSLPGYGWSAGTAFNEVDFERKVYVQRVQRADMGLLNWFDNGSLDIGTEFATRVPDKAFGITNMISAKFRAGETREIGVIRGRTDTGTVSSVYNLGTTVNEFKEFVSGEMLYYELANPIETDISTLLDDSFENIEVEGGGTVEFKQSGDYRLPVPNREEYIVSVADAGGGA